MNYPTTTPNHPIQAEEQRPHSQMSLNNLIHTSPAAPPVDTESRGIKRKLAGWTAPVDYPYPQAQKVVPQPHNTVPIPDVVSAAIVPEVFIQETDTKPVIPVPPEAQIKSEQSPPPSASPPSVAVALPQEAPPPPPKKYARMGTRVPGSGDLGGSGPRRKHWPQVAGVRIDAAWRMHEGGSDEGKEKEQEKEKEEQVLEEECYTWTDLPMNKQGFRYIPCGPSPSPTVQLSSTASLSYPPFNRRIPALCMPFGKSEDTAQPPTHSSPSSSAADEQPPPPAPSPPKVHLDFLDRSTYLKISPSGLTCTAEKGFRSVRGNIGVRAGGAWYFECLVLKGGGEGKSAGAGAEENGWARGKGGGPVSERFGLGAGLQSMSSETRSVSSDNHSTPAPPPPATTTTTTNTTAPNPTSSSHNPIPTSATTSSSSDGAHVRLGWARREAPLNGPCGLDGYSYGVRDATGEKVTISRLKAYAGKGFGTGDVVGCLIYLPDHDDHDHDHDHEDDQVKDEKGKEKQREDPVDPAVVRRKRIPIRYKGQLYFESVEYTVPKEMEALVARDGRPVDPLPVVEAGGATTHGSSSGKQGKRSLSDSPVKKKKAGKQAGGKGKQAGKAVRKKPLAGSRKHHSAGQDDESSEEDQTRKPRQLPRIAGSKISFFLNGKPMASDPAFEDIFSFLPLRPTDAELATRAAVSKKLGALEASLRDRENYNDDGTLGYYPFISCFGGGKVQFHPGPRWMAPVDPKSWGLGERVGEGGCWEPIVPRPLSERWDEYYQEEMVYDERDEKEVAALLKKEALSEAAKKRVKSEKSSSSSTGKPSKASVAKRATMAAALQASTPISRASSAVPSMNGSTLASSNAPSVLLGTIIQDRGTPGGTPAPGTPVDGQFNHHHTHTQTQTEDSRSSPPRTITSASSPAPAPLPLAIDVRDPYAIYQRDGTAVSATSEDAPGEDDWSQEPEHIDGGPTAVEDDDAPELPYGMETPPPPPLYSVGQIQERVVDNQQGTR